MDFCTDESKILVIYTGGTIGMLIGTDGYKPEPYYLTEFLRSQARFHDPLQDSLFSNSGSSNTYREWSGRITPTSLTDAPKHQPTLLVKSTRHTSPSADLAPSTSHGPTPHRSPSCVQLSENVYESQLPSLVTPRSSSGRGAKRIRYAILEVGL
jgi:60kDa lysophospholipase